jgi:hypothetical protein
MGCRTASPVERPAIRGIMKVCVLGCAFENLHCQARDSLAQIISYLHWTDREMFVSPAKHTLSIGR